LVLLVAVLIPGVGRSVNGARPLAAACDHQHPAIRIRQARRRAVRGELRGPQSRAHSCRTAVEADVCFAVSRRCSR
jgi:hypothetical protein